MVEWEAHFGTSQVWMRGTLRDITGLSLGFATNSCNWCFMIFLSPFRKMGSQDSLVSTVMLPAGISRVHVLVGARDFSILQNHWRPLVLRLRMRSAVLLLPLYAFMVWSGICLPTSPPPLLLHDAGPWPFLQHFVQYITKWSSYPHSGHMPVLLNKL